MRGFEQIRDVTNPLGLKSLNAQLKNLYFRVQNITDKDLRPESVGGGAIQLESIDWTHIKPASITTDRINAQLVVADDLQAVNARIGNLEVVKANVTELNAAIGRIATLEADSATIIQLEAVNARIDNLKVDTAMILDAAITNAKIADATIEGAKIAHGTIGTAHIELGAITTALIDTGAIGTVQIADGSITDAKIVELTANKITAGTLSVERLEIRGSESSIVYALNNITGALQAQNVDTLNGEILTERTITADKIVANAITANEIAAQTITANEIASNAITADKIAAEAITANKIKTGEIDSIHIKSGAITATKINVESLSAISADLGTVTAGTLTGTTIRTSATGDRVELSSNLLRAYSNGIRRVQLGYDSFGFYTYADRFAGEVKGGETEYEAESVGGSSQILQIPSMQMFGRNGALVRVESEGVSGSNAAMELLAGSPLHLGEIKIHVFDNSDSECYLRINRYGGTINGFKIVTGFEAQAGNLDIVPVANQPTGVRVYFPYRFLKTPTAVVASANTSVPGSTLHEVSFLGITMEYTTLYIYRTNTTATNVAWIAMTKD